jgi:hypothetical protein
MLTFHEIETCEGIIQHLELRERAERRDVQVRDVGNHVSPDARVEMTFRLGEQLYAIEHTGIEPFDGFMEHQNRAPALFKPLEDALTVALSDMLTAGDVIELQMSIDAFDGRRLPEVRAIHDALVPWVSDAAPTLAANRYAEYQHILKTQPPGVPFQVTLVRFKSTLPPPGFFILKHVTRGLEEPRSRRIERACEKKFPKLAMWKRSDNARTVLVLEDNDVQLTNPSIVAEAFLPIARGRDDAPDETYLVSTYNSPWYACPILVNDRPYFELAEISYPNHFEMDATGALR